MAGNYPAPTGAMWKRTDRMGREYYYLQIDMDDLRYAFHVFTNKFKQSQTQPDFKVFPLDNGEGKKIEKRYEPKSDYKTQAPPDMGDGDDESVEDGKTSQQPEEDDAPF